MSQIARALRPAHVIEALETRIAPASIVTISSDHKTATWTDVDGDLVTLKASKAIFDPNNANEFTFLPQQTGDVGYQLALLDLHTVGSAFAGVSLTFTAQRNSTTHQGDGAVNVGRIDATGLDLGAVSVAGDLASISAGDANLSTAAISSITVLSAGALGTATQGATLNAQPTYLDWLFIGKVGSVTIKGDSFVALDADDTASGGPHSNPAISIGPVTIWGNLMGGSDAQTGYTGVGSGYVFSEGSIGAVKIGGDILGGSSQFGGSVSAEGSIAGVSVGGDLNGFTGDDTAEISGMGLGKVVIGGSIFGNVGGNSGTVSSGSTIASITVGGEIDGGSGPSSGAISATTLGPVSVKLSLNGGDGSDSGEISGNNITSVTIGGSVSGGSVPDTGEINAGSTIGAVTISGSLIGGGGQNSGFIEAGTMIKTVSIGGDIDGSSGIGSGQISTAALKSLTIRGSINGGSVQSSGQVNASALGSATVLGSLFGGGGDGSGQIVGDSLGSISIGGTIGGGSGDSSGSIYSSGAIGSVTVGGSIFGGSNSHAGGIDAQGALGKVTIGGSVDGGNTPRDNQGDVAVNNNDVPILIYAAGSIESGTSIDAVSIGGNILPGQGNLCGTVFTDTGSHGNIKSVSIAGTLQGFTSFDAGNGHTAHVENGIYADGQLGPVTVGAISGSDPTSPAQIVAQGKASPTKATDALAIASVTVARGVFAGEILAGYSDGSGSFTNPDVQIGAVKVANNFIGSSISAGVTNTGNGFGDATNAIATAATGFTNSAAISSRIISVTIGGYILGNPFHTADFVTGFVAQDIGAVKLGGTALELTPTTPANLDVFVLGIDHDFFVREVA